MYLVINWIQDSISSQWQISVGWCMLWFGIDSNTVSQSKENSCIAAVLVPPALHTPSWYGILYCFASATSFETILGLFPGPFSITTPFPNCCSLSGVPMCGWRSRTNPCMCGCRTSACASCCRISRRVPWRNGKPWNSFCWKRTGGRLKRRGKNERVGSWVRQNKF